MKRIEAIIKGRKFTEALFGLKKSRSAVRLKPQLTTPRSRKKRPQSPTSNCSPVWPRTMPTISASSRR